MFLSNTIQNMATVSLVVGVASLSGCEELQKVGSVVKDLGNDLVTQSSDTDNPQKASVVKGGAAGLVGYGILKSTSSKNPEVWAAAIGVGTYVIDRQVTKKVQERRAGYEKESDYLDAEIELADQTLETKTGVLAQIDGDIQRLTAEANAHTLAAQQNRLSKAEADKTVAELAKLHEQTNEEILVAEGELEIITEALNTTKSATDTSVSEEELKDRQSTLLTKRDQRLNQYNVLVGYRGSIEELENVMLASR